MNELKKTIGLLMAPVALIAAIAAFTTVKSDSAGERSQSISSSTTKVTEKKSEDSTTQTPDPLTL